MVDLVTSPGCNVLVRFAIEQTIGSEYQVLHSLAASMRRLAIVAEQGDCFAESELLSEQAQVLHDVCRAIRPLVNMNDITDPCQLPSDA